MPFCRPGGNTRLEGIKKIRHTVWGIRYIGHRVRMKTIFFADIFVELKFYSSKYFNTWMPVPQYLGGAVKIFARLDLDEKS